MPTDLQRIETIVIVMMENRSFNPPHPMAGRPRAMDSHPVGGLAFLAVILHIRPARGQDGRVRVFEKRRTL